MVSYRAFHSRFLKKRQDLSGVLGGLSLPSASSSSSTADRTTASASSSAGDPGGIIGGVTSLLGGIDPQSSSTTSSTASAPLTHASSGSTGSTTTTSAPRSSAPSSTSVPSTSADLTTPSSSPSPSATSSPSDAVVYTSSDGTSIVYITSTPPAASSTSAAPTSFLSDPSLEGGVFTIVGIVALIIIFVVVTWTLRKRRRDRLERDLAAAVTFDPGATDMYEHHEASIEKHRLSGSSSGHGHGYGYGMPQMGFAPQMDYHNPMGYGQYSAAGAYGVPYQGSPPAAPHSTAQGGANLTRKYSDRKPVPPLLPDPAYDPVGVNAAVPLPPQSYQP